MLETELRQGHRRHRNHAGDTTHRGCAAAQPQLPGPQPGRLAIQVIDNGVGIRPEHLAKIFSHGFTTRKDGHGFGLHSGALAAHELGGSLVADSAGLGQGATFTLELPLNSYQPS